MPPLVGVSWGVENVGETYTEPVGQNSGGKVAAKKESQHLCESCRRKCKQPPQTVLVHCPRYYHMPRIKAELLYQDTLWDPRPEVGRRRRKK